MQLYPPSHYDDAANGCRLITTVPLASAMGAEIRGADLRKLNDEVFREIEGALLRYKMIYFRDQDITVDHQEQFTRRFGEFGTDAYTAGMEGHPNVQRLVKEADTVVPRVFGETWHTDSAFLPRPPAISILYAGEVPPYGGDTWWSNTELAYERLSPPMQQLLAGLKVHMSARDVVLNRVETGAQGGKKVGNIPLTMDEQRIIEGTRHPLVRTHPATGRKSLYLDHAYSVGLDGLEDEEAEAILAFLKQHVARELFCCRLRWQSRTLVAWDNRSCIHYAFNDYDGYRREMYRTIVDGEVPV